METLPQKDFQEEKETLKNLQQIYSVISKQLFSTINNVEVKQAQEKQNLFDQNELCRQQTGTQGNTQKDHSQMQVYKILQDWFLDNLSNPYPCSSTRTSLAKQTGLSTNQVHIWFNNTRQRYLDPLKKKANLKLQKIQLKLEKNKKLELKEQNVILGKQCDFSKSIKKDESEVLQKLEPLYEEQVSSRKHINESIIERISAENEFVLLTNQMTDSNILQNWLQFQNQLQYQGLQLTNMPFSFEKQAYICQQWIPQMIYLQNLNNIQPSRYY